MLTLMAITAGALAQPAAGAFTDDVGVLTAATVDGSGNWSTTISTIGSPAVFVDTGVPFIDVPVMIYETQVGAADANCPAGRWALGLARLTFGGWADFGPIVEPTAGTYYSCVAAHPAVVPFGDPANRQWVVYFKAELDEANCVSNPQFDCVRYPGLGRLVISGSGPTFVDPLVYTVTTAVSTEPVLEEVAQDMGYPSVIFADGEYHMAYAQKPDLYIASSAFTTDFGIPGSPAVSLGDGSGWDTDELYSPSLNCEGTAPSVDYLLFTGGRELDSYPFVVDASMGLFTSTDLVTFTEPAASPYLQVSAGDNEMRHLDVQRDGSNYAVFYATPRTPGTASNDIRRAYMPGFSQLSIEHKRCP